MERRTLIALFVVVVYIGTVSPNAIFEVDLLKYEALPNKCCDGYRNIHFGPLRCNECDPYFRICLKQPSSSASHCVKTSRANNVHTQDLTHGNIQPNHLSMSLDHWQGSLLVDVDIKDYDSTTKDDDIDHLLYTYKGLPDPTSKTILMNGTKVRLTIAVKIYCSTNYYGPDCSTSCVNDNSSYCDLNGIKHCKPGFGGQDCSLNTDNGKTSAIDNTVTETITRVSTNQHVHSSVATGHITDVHALQSSSTKLPADATEHNESYNPTIAKNKGMVTNSVIIKVNTDSKHIATSIGTREARTSVHQLATGANTNDKAKVSIHSQTTESASESVSNGHVKEQTTSLPNGMDTTAPLSHSHVNSEGSTITTASKTTQKIYVPEPIELYSCNMLVQGHRTGVHTEVVSVIYTALSAHQMFVPNNLLGVNAISSTFEVTDNGLDITDVSYVVNYDGQVLRTESVVHVLAQPQIATVFNEQMTAKNLHQYQPKKMTATSSDDTPKTWVSNHLPFVIVMSCIVLVLVIVPVTFYCRRSYNQRATGVKKSSKRQGKEWPSRDSPNYDMSYSIENPMYDYDNNGPKAFP